MPDLDYNTIPELDYNSLMEICNIFDECVGDEDITLSEAFIDNFKNEKIEAFKDKINKLKDLKNQWTKLSIVCLLINGYTDM